MLPQSEVATKLPFVLTQSIKSRWFEFFGISDVQRNVYFTYHWKAVESYFLKGMFDLGFNYKNVLHLGHKVEFKSRDCKFNADSGYTVEIRLQDISILDRNRIVFINQTIVRDISGVEISIATDQMFVRNVSESTIDKIQSSSEFNRTDLSDYRGLSKRSASLGNLTDAKEVEVAVPVNGGLKYGEISGDLNPIHTSEVLAKLFGYKRPFIQGMWTVNFLNKYFSFDLNESVKSIDLKFCRPLFLDQLAKLKYQKNNFEILDQFGELVAFGRRDHF